MIDVNLKGFLYGIAAALPVFRKQGSGHFVSIVSTAGLTVSPTMAVYAGTKNAVRTVSEGLRQEAGDKLRVTCISPGFVKTSFADSMTNPEIRQKIRTTQDQIAISPDAIARAHRICDRGTARSGCKRDRGPAHSPGLTLEKDMSGVCPGRWSL